MKKISLEFRFFKDFLHVKHNRYILISSLILFFMALSSPFLLPDYQLFPNIQQLDFGFYTDKANGGNSQILHQSMSDSAIAIDFDLKEGFTSPYIGISIKKKNDASMDLRWYNRICIDIKGDDVKAIGVSLFTANPTAIANSKDLCFNSKLVISSVRKLYCMDMEQLKVPDWWYDMYNTPLNQKITPDLKHVFTINIGTSYHPVKTSKRNLKIYRIFLERDNTHLYVIIFLSELFLIFVLMLVHYFRTRPEKEVEPIRIEYKSVAMDSEAANPTEKSFIDFINTNYHESELSLEMVANSTGVQQRHITKYIHETFECNFKTYVNRIRINESKRLLLKTELNIGEVSYKVGFSNQSHFNRVFKTMEGMNPSEFREAKK